MDHCSINGYDPFVHYHASSSVRDAGQEEEDVGQMVEP